MKIDLDLDLRTINKAMEKRTDEAERAIKRRVANAANLVRNTAVTSILRDPKTGSIRADGHVHSAAGEPPASDTGFLANSITTDLKHSKGMAEAHVIASAPYAAYLEFGTQNMAPRPFMQPALEKNKRKIEQAFKQRLLSE